MSTKQTRWSWLTFFSGSQVLSATKLWKGTAVWKNRGIVTNILIHVLFCCHWFAVGNFCLVLAVLPLRSSCCTCCCEKPFNSSFSPGCIEYSIDVLSLYH